MRYSEIVDYPRSWNREKYPSIAHVFIATGQFCDFEQLIADQTQTVIIGHDITANEVLVYVACTSEDVKDAVESHWG
jgi:hypothetical protein